MAWVVCLRGWCTCVGGVLACVAWVARVSFETKMKKMFQIVLDSDLKEEPDFKGRCWFTLFRPVMQGSRICLNLLKYALMWANIPR